VNREDERLLDRTLELARRGRRTASPNPVVGCVIVKGDYLLGEGWHERPGERHAETIALAKCNMDPRGATAYVSLEPCCHHGRQPPCTEALIEAGITRVVCAAGDPSQKVGGKGFARLREAGVEVEVAEGEIELRARRQNAAFRVHAVDGRPYVLLKLAASLDGRIATATGESRWISSEESRQVVHDWRAAMDAVAVGSGTALADDPELTPRDAEPAAERQPLRVVFDRRGRLRRTSKLVRSLDAVEPQGGPVLRVAPAGAPDPPGRVERLDAESAAEALQLLGRRRITSLLVEGGPELATGLIRDGLVDSVALFLAPTLLGGDGRPMLDALGVGPLADAPALRGLRTHRVGPDVLVRGELRDLP
jgi:diaminohydroxyphosphoribosylaminopyrimidine deaminase/5-amino-6-(5-phosphoribosylamino)uracil reductase